MKKNRLNDKQRPGPNYPSIHFNHTRYVPD